MQETEQIISKTQRKQEMHELQDLGEELVALPKDKLRQIELPENLRDAILEAQRITAHGGRKRQLQYIGKLMRTVDAEPILQKMKQWQGQHAAETARMHQLENWRNRLINDAAALSEFVTLHQGADVQHLRTLIRNAQKEASTNKPPKSSRELFKAIRDIIASSAAKPAAE
ncbi:MAG TPA: ribosome biogenesis factor YjgA [Methylophilaceae bacterium]|jgi:ribosome-associated protein